MRALARAYLLANWKQLAGVAAAFGVMGYAVHRCPQAVHLAETESAQATTQATQEQTVRAGPVKVTKVEEQFRSPGAQLNGPVSERPESDRGRSSGEAPSQLISRTTTVTEQGPTTTETHAVTESASSATRTLDLTVTPQARAGWALQVGLEDVLHGGEVRVAVRRRLLGPFWAEAAALPRTRAVGVGLSVEW